MSETVHRDVIITISCTDPTADTEWLTAWSRALPQELKQYFLGPFNLCNGTIRYFFMSSGSGEGWRTSREHHTECLKLLRYFKARAPLVTQAEGMMPSVQNILYTASEEWSEENLIEFLEKHSHLPEFVRVELARNNTPFRETIVGKTIDYLRGRRGMNERTAQLHPDPCVKASALARSATYDAMIRQLNQLATVAYKQ